MKQLFFCTLIFFASIIFAQTFPGDKLATDSQIIHNPPVIQLMPNLPISPNISGPKTVKPGDKPIYSASVKNNTDSELRDVELNVSLLPLSSLEMSMATPGFEIENDILTWKIPVLAANEQKSFKIMYEAKDGMPTLLTLSASVKEASSIKCTSIYEVRREVEAQMEAVSEYRFQLAQDREIIQESQNQAPQLAAIEKIANPQRRVLAALKLASLQAELFGVKSAESAITIVLRDLASLESFEIKMEAICILADLYRDGTEKHADE